jgi:hypothetical protein
MTQIEFASAEILHLLAIQTQSIKPGNCSGEALSTKTSARTSANHTSTMSATY